MEPEETRNVEKQLELDAPELDTPELSAGFPWAGLVSALGTVLVVVFAVQNTDSVNIKFLWMSGGFPVAIIIAVTALIAAILTAIGGVFYRRSRVNRRIEKEELRRHRGRP